MSAKSNKIKGSVRKGGLNEDRPKLPRPTPPQAQRMVKNVFYLITSEQTEGSIGLPVCFTPELHNNKTVAETRHAELQAGRSEYCGYFFSLTPIELNKQNEDW